MFKIFHADLSLDHPDLKKHYEKISRDFYWGRLINVKKNRTRLKTLGKLCFFLKYPEKIKNPVTTFFEKPNKILSIHPGTGRLIAAYLRQDSSIPIIGVTFTEYCYSEEVYMNSEFIKNFEIKEQTVGKSSYAISSEGKQPDEYHLITVPEHINFRRTFGDEKIKHLRKCLRDKQLYNVDLFIEDIFLCNLSKDRFRKSSTVINIENQQGFYDLCMYLSGLSELLPPENIQISTL